MFKKNIYLIQWTPLNGFTLGPTCFGPNFGSKSNQCFSTSIPQNPGVPWASLKGSAEIMFSQNFTCVYKFLQVSTKFYKFFLTRYLILIGNIVAWTKMPLQLIRHFPTNDPKSKKKINFK
jgi:hypothetical protein